MAGSEEDSIMDLLRPFMRNEVTLLRVAKKLDSHEITVHVLLSLSESDLEGLIKKVFPAASVAEEFGLKAAIKSRKENPTHGSPSGSLSGVDEKIMKRFAEFLDEKEATKKSKKSWAISSVKSPEWDTLERASGLSLSLKDLQYTPTRMSDLPPFGWDDSLQRSQADRYMSHLNTIRRAGKWMMINAANIYPNLLDGQLGSYTIRGTTDVAVILRVGLIDPPVCLRCIFQLKKNDARQGRHQILVGLVMANILSKQFRPFAVLTDLIDEWILYWMDGPIIYFTTCQSRAVAVGIIEDLLGEDQDIDPSAGLPFLATVGSGEGESAFSSFLRRREYVPPGSENMEDLIGLIPDHEIFNARVEAGLRDLQQMLQRPEFAGLLQR